NQKEEKENNAEDGQPNKNQVVWGVDSASLTTNELLACVKENFGNPQIWGRYLGEKEGVSKGLTANEIELLHSNDINILVIWNHFTDATGYENGQNQAREAIQEAKELGIPQGVAIFADIEPNYPVDSEFIRGWFEVMNDSEYAAGIYGIFDAERELSQAFQQAAQSNKDLLENTYLWTAAPNTGITSESNAPEYQPEAPENSLIAGWQYGIDAQACNIDTNLFNGQVLDVVW
ncbi:MAG TPA: glycoside hydrolase domain-containing protein, partial [Chondromyces sp.]|nr:glycoside hydrolase domain-containing protein [Chondromyces sp.]